MARSIIYWYNVIDTERLTFSNLLTLQPSVNSAQDLLQDVTSTSRAARWRLYIWCVAVCAFAIDVLFGIFKTDLEAISMRSRFGTIPWYNYVSKKFQYGDTLVWIDNAYQYAVVDTSLQIIKMAAAEEVGNMVNVKVAKLVGSVVTKLSAAEKAAFVNYISDAEKVKPAGVIVNVISDDADQLRLFVNVKYDRLLLSAAGELLSSPGTFPVNDVINLFISNTNINNFNGELELFNLVQEIKTATGVVAAYVTNAQSRYGANPFVTFAERQKARAGYFVIDPATPLSVSVIYE